MMSGIDGRNDITRLSWEQFQAWQRWDEFPERKNDPPMTVDMVFWYMDNKYYLDSVNHVYAILTEKWKIVEKDVNFLNLLNKPIKEWGGDSFHKLIEKMIFKN